jgi:hemoglobin
MTGLADIQTRDDIRRLVDRFYDKALKDAVIGFLFTEVAKIDLPTHLPKLYDFWEMVLLGGQNYQGNPMVPHFHLHLRHPLELKHFTRWLELFHQTVDENFSGPTADLAKARSERIAQNFHARIQEGEQGGLFIRPAQPK